MSFTLHLLNFLLSSTSICVHFSYQYWHTEFDQFFSPHVGKYKAQQMVQYYNNNTNFINTLHWAQCCLQCLNCIVCQSLKLLHTCSKCSILKRLCHKSKEPLHRRLLVHDLLLSPIQTSNSLIIQVSEETKSWLWWGSVLKGWRVGAVMWSLTLSCSEKGTTEWGPHEMNVSWQTEGQLKSPMAHRPFISAISEGLPTLQRGSSPTLLVLLLVCCFFCTIWLSQVYIQETKGNGTSFYKNYP